MTLNAPSFFAGIGTVLGLLIVGFGGGVLMSGVISDTTTPREPNRIEKRAAETAKPPVIEAKPAVVAAPAPQPAPPPPQVAEPAPTPQVQRANSQSEPPAQRVEPQPVPQVRRVDLPPPPASQVQEVKPQADPQPGVPSQSVHRAPLGPEQPVALPNPAPDRSAAQREARRKAEEVRKLERKRKHEERKLAEQRRQQRIKETEELKAATRSKQVEVDDEDDNREQRPSFFRREREEPFGRPFFRLFGNDD